MKDNFTKPKRLIDLRHPKYVQDDLYWLDWRYCYESGPDYVARYLRKFSERETESDFESRKFYTPIPSFAKAAVNDIRNSIFQRLRDVIRRDGSSNYMKSAAGEEGGVDNRGSSMQSFFGIDVLTELLVMGRVGVYVDMPVVSGVTLADIGNERPYVYMYRVEDILSWTLSRPGEPGEFSAVLLRDRGLSYDAGFAPGGHLPGGDFVQYRYMWVDPFTGKVKMQLYDDENMPMFFDDTPDGNTITLDLDRIPFTMLDIQGSVLKDVYRHQIALLNLGSSDVSYALKANFPFYTEQKDMRNVGEHLRANVSDEGSTTTSDNTRPGNEMRVGVTQGRAYDLKADRPGFIHPSPEPLMASIKLQERLEDSIRSLVNLSVQNKSGQQAISAEAMRMSDQGLEAGLSYIGLVLEGGERAVAQFWAAYESKDKSKRQVATVKYPDRYSLKDDGDRINEAQELSKLMYAVPGRTIKRELARGIVTVLLSGKVSTDKIDTIFEEIEEAEYTTSDPEIIIKAQEAGLVGEETASIALGFSDEEYLAAREDHISRATRILEAQADVSLKAKTAEAELAMQMGGQAGPGGKPTMPKVGDDNEGVERPGARGVEDLALEKGEGEEEREEATDTTMKADRTKPVRGEGKKLNKGE